MSNPIKPGTQVFFKPSDSEGFRLRWLPAILKTAPVAPLQLVFLNLWRLS